MTVKEVIQTTAIMIGRNDIVDYFNGKSSGTDTVENVSSLEGLVNLVINELSCTYIPLVKVETVIVTLGKVYFSDLSEKILHVRGVYSQHGKAVPYTETAKYLSVDMDKVDIEYEYTPKLLKLDDQIGYDEKDVPTRVLAYGVAAEFAISERRFDEAVTFHKRYVDALSEMFAPKNSIIRQRSFI